MLVGKNIREDYIQTFCSSKPDKAGVFLISIIIGALKHRGFRAVMLYRIGRFFQTRGHRILAKMVKQLIPSLCFCTISMNADIGPGFHIHLPFGLVVGGDLKAGKNFDIRLDSTLGGRHGWYRPDGSSFPRIGDNVIVAGGVRMLGPVDVGDNCIVGANSVVISNVPSDCVVAGVPARIIKRNGQRVSMLEDKGELSDILRELIERVEKLEEKLGNHNSDRTG